MWPDRQRAAGIGLALLLLVPVAALLGRLILFAQHSADMIAFPWQIDFDEGVILHSSWLLAGGHTPYPPLSPDRFVSSVYPPLFYLLNAVALKIWGLNLWSGRALSLLGTLLVAGALLAWTAAETRSRSSGLVAAALWLAAGPVIIWGTFYKQDVLALGLGALGGALLATGAPRPSASPLPPLAWWAILPLVLAFWTKQSTLAPLAAGGLYLVGREWRSGLRWCAAAALALVAPFVALNLLLDGQLAAHLFLPGAEALSGVRLGKNLGALWAEHWPPLILAGLTAAGLLGTAFRARRVPALSVLYAGISLPAVVLTNLSPLANYNHLLIGWLPACLLAGVGLGHAAHFPSLGLRLGALAAAVALLLLQPGLLGPIKNWYTPFGQPLAEKAARLAGLEHEVAAAPGAAVLTEDAWLALSAGKLLPYDDPAMMAVQAQAGHWDERGFLDDVARHRFGLVVLEHDISAETYSPRWSPDALAALQANYTPKYRDVRFLDVPRPPPARPPQPPSCTLAGGPRLAGIFLPGGGRRLAPGDVQPLSLYWAGAVPDAPAAALKFSVRLVDARGHTVWQADLPPGGAAGLPWPAWPTGAAPRDDLQVAVPPDAAPGPYVLSLGAYLPSGAGFAPLPFACAGGAATPVLVLGTPQMQAAGGP